MSSEPSIFDVTVIGAGRAGSVVAEALTDAGFSVCVIDEKTPICANVTRVFGKGFVSGPRSVAVLDPKSGDEAKLVQSQAIVVAVGCSEGIPNTKFLGLRKLGVDTDPNTGHLIIKASGGSSCPSVFAVGSCCSASGSVISQEAVASGIATLLQSAVPAGSRE